MEIWHNPRCSKSRATLALLQEHGVEPAVRRYLDAPPSRAEIEGALAALGTDDPLVITRTGEAAFREQGLKGADRDTLLDALAAEPKLIERPLVRSGDRAVLGRPPENVLPLIEG
ncbi:Arsenate reductase [Pseudonocardia sp. Ae168_Ps1]|uniref:arsenate reductase (glutaredoxin) n=1 Tax=unclassified Pseudonocardia TaxID=2619320 RepID=UPI00094B4742|nr:MULTISPECIES: arsenate reductase (glutaredoxin) [unclassified Pseudonocardia]OLL75239.1 Arsenate reductase [Pseudonocardia sp. Ae150A_Ps1]OLL81233.1 Arsenate reductase [Pseudonocardia sp. Ae168_Ps1]OLL84653.1 Arsenate reductase [Pseudonocardia sp. Ae263_Ps1]OLL95330.1 Arsenate reductase [Pseudonocardia sp. Ae356_Ps1]